MTVLILARLKIRASRRKAAMGGTATLMWFF
jgi:hypothetical protein